jgi:HAD superfamily hydrolase (TIGR01509 family)
MGPPFTPQLVIFDMDGTLTRPYIDFARIKEHIGAGEMPILEFIASIEDVEERRRVRAIVDEYERDAAENSTLNADVGEVLTFLRGRKIPVAILTRNNRSSVETVLDRHGLKVDLFVTAEDDLPPKPSPEPVLHIARRFGVSPSDVMIVGDFRFDVMSGRAAGARTVFLTNGALPGETGDADYVIDGLCELISIIRDGAMPGRLRR